MVHREMWDIEIYINEILLEKKQQLEFGDVICIGTIYLLFFENYIAVEVVREIQYQIIWKK